MGFRRWVQAVCLVVFLFMLATGDRLINADLFARMDPALTGVAAIAGRTLAWAFLPALIVALSALLIGRAFCGYICPMGTTIDAADAAIKPKKRRKNPPPKIFRPGLKTIIVFFLSGAAAAGVSLVFWASPLSLITRFYGTVIYPVAWLLADRGILLFYPVFDLLDIRGLMFLEVEPRRFAANFFVFLLFVAIFAAARYAPRFWCRYICPAGGILALLSKKPLIRRQVDENCDQCGKCSENCPMGAIPDTNAAACRHDECLACKTCETSCHRDAIRFSLSGEDITFREVPEAPASPGRRRFLVSGIAGAGTAAVGMTGLMAVPSADAEGRVLAPRLIRPPGALPDPDFLQLCVRCGQCMAACPTNTLQPTWFAAGVTGMFSPAVIPARNYCDPRCRACGNVCPTGAILKMTPAQRVWAKTGTAVIYRQRCIAWEYEKSCMVCDEVCPYEAVEFEEKEDLPYPVPRVIEDRCAGCGYCEHYCPVENDAAIVVTPMNALRLSRPEYREEGAMRGYELSLRADAGKFDPDELAYPGAEPDAYPPADDPENGMAPGFDTGYN